MSDPILDFGEKIGGARKDLRGNFLSKDLGSMTHIERIKYTTKNMVWPTPDYAALLREGKFNLEALAMIKMLRDVFPPTPLVRRDVDAAAYKRASEVYVNTLNAAREVTSHGPTVFDLRRALRDSPLAREHLCIVSDYRFGVGSFCLAEGLASWRENTRTTAAVYRRIYDTLYWYSEGRLNQAMRRFLSRNPQWPECQSRTERFFAKHQLGTLPNPDGPGFVVSIFGRLPSAEWKAYYKGSYHGIDITPVWDSPQEAMQAMRASYEAAQGKRRAAQKAERDAKLDRAKVGAAVTGCPPVQVSATVYRHGTEWRNYVPATGEHYLRDFRLRGGEFGVWVNQTERQQVLDRGYDAFCDLAQAIGFERKETMSLGGSLAIAFGSRGRGGLKAPAAHYEPGRMVINLTKPNGAGCLAHEWAHAFDHYLGLMAHKLGLVVATDAATGLWAGDNFFLSNCTLRGHANHDDGPEVAYLQSMRRMMETIWKQAKQFSAEESLAIARQKHTTLLAQFHDNIEVAQSHIGRYVLQANGVPVEQHAAKLAATRVILDGLKSPDFSRNPVQVRQIIQALHDVTGPKGRMAWFANNIRYYHHHLHCADAAITEALLPNFRPVTVLGPTSLAEASVKLDEGKKPYYACQHEMFARAIESCVADQLRVHGRHSPYLVGPTEGEAYPAGSLRVRLNHQLLASVRGFEGVVQRVVQDSPQLDSAKPAMQVATRGGFLRGR